MGAVTPLGNDVESTWDNLVAGKSGAADIEQWDASEYPVNLLCELKDFDPRQWLDHKQARRMDRFAQMSRRGPSGRAGLGARRRVRSRAHRRLDHTGILGLKAFRTVTTSFWRGPDRVNPFRSHRSSRTWALPGSRWSSARAGRSRRSAACAASNMAIGEAGDMIRLGRADAVFAGGTEAGVTSVGIAGFSAMRALSRRNDAPEKASRPFDAARDGFVMGEAGAVILLEELEHAKARGAKIYAEILGYGLSSDAKHVSEPDPTGENPARAMRMALADAGIQPEDIDYINAHGTSTPLGDASETKVIKLALGEEVARATPVSSTKAPRAIAWERPGPWRRSSRSSP